MTSTVNISDPDLSYGAHGCNVKIQGRAQGSVKSFHVFIKESDVYKFDRVRAAIVAQTHGKDMFNIDFYHDCTLIV